MTLFNIGHIYLENKQSETAIQIWVKVYQLAKPMQLAQALDALENAAKDLGSEEGLALWERLAQDAKLNPPSRIGILIMNQPQAPISSRPPNLNERLMQERFSEAIAAQSQLMDHLAQRLLTLELAIPSLYVQYF